MDSGGRGCRTDVKCVRALYTARAEIGSGREMEEMKEIYTIYYNLPEVEECKGVYPPSQARNC